VRRERERYILLDYLMKRLFEDTRFTSLSKAELARAQRPLPIYLAFAPTTSRPQHPPEQSMFTLDSIDAKLFQPTVLGAKFRHEHTTTAVSAAYFRCVPAGDDSLGFAEV
jgi:hypothetical protein